MEGTKTKKRKRQPKKEGPNRRGRIIVRNLPFKTTEETLKTHFEQFGPIVEVKVLKRPDGKLVGCGFVQFQVVQNAAKAIFNTTGKPFLGRPIICDWALGKNTYVKNIIAANAEIKNEPVEIKDDIKKEEMSDKEDEIKKEEISDEEDEGEVKETDKESSDETSEEDSSSEVDETDDESEDEIKTHEDEPELKKPRIISNDINEGKTVFIKNVPFSATNDDLKECILQFGPLFYALVCVDPITEHSKGTAFVKFKDETDAQKCLMAGTELTLMGNILDCHKAMSKNDLQNKTVNKEEKKDSRNLYLVKEGVILAGSKAADSVSASDMAKRLQLEKWKTQMLRNLNMFVSRFRLVIHNLPLSYDDNKLRQLISKYSGPKSIIKETKVMRNMNVLESDGKGRSKEFGFVSFQNHEDALKVLRALNNNPTVFSETKRPIVSFSIENKAVLNARNRRMEKSKLNNPTYKIRDSNPIKKKIKTAINKKQLEENKRNNETKSVKKKKKEPVIKYQHEENKSHNLNNEVGATKSIKKEKKETCN